MKVIKISLVVFVSAFIQASCTKAIIDENNTTTGSDTVTYAADIQPIMYNNCTTCHAGEAPSAGLDLSNYTNVRSSAEFGNLVNRVNNADNPMPGSGLLPESTRLKIDKWVENGFPE